VAPYAGQKAFVFFDEAEAEGPSGGDPFSADHLADLLNMRQIPLVVLNACQSGKQVGAAETSLGSRLLAAGVQLVVAMGYSVTVSAARLLMTTLYGHLLAGREPAVAIRRARLELYHNKRRQAAYGQEIPLEDWLLPVIYQNRPPDFGPHTFTGEWTDPGPLYAPPRTTYHFVGRDLDILHVERPPAAPQPAVNPGDGRGGQNHPAPSPGLVVAENPAGGAGLLLWVRSESLPPAGNYQPDRAGVGAAPDRHRRRRPGGGAARVEKPPPPAHAR
jgi:hypothetical protein